MDKIRSCPTFFNFVIHYNCITTMSWRLPCFHINYQNNKTMKMNFAMVVRPKNLMILKNEEQRWERTSELTYAASPVESLIQRALHHMMGNSSQRGSLDLTTACSFKWTQIRFIWDIHIHIFMAWYTRNICTNVNDKQLPPFLSKDRPHLWPKYIRCRRFFCLKR